ncbi:MULTISPECIES: hypothetical protein [Kitasatospora]|nr:MULTISPECIES: hypothetical protein [Kitasatospora]MDH6143635.1 hypothetical protein [Kitasatospora sp. GP30]
MSHLPLDELPYHVSAPTPDLDGQPEGIAPIYLVKAGIVAVAIITAM